MALKFSSTAFTPGGQIPRKHTCDGADVSPALNWSDPPEKTRAFALIVDDPDAPAGTWVHWVLWDLPAAERGLPEGVEKKEELPSGARQGRNDFKRIGYGGPCPPAGRTIATSSSSMRWIRNSISRPAQRKPSSRRPCRATCWRRSS